MGKHYNSKKRARRLFRQMSELQDQLTDTALVLSHAITERIADAPLNQLATALSTVVDRMMKLDDYMRQNHPHPSQASTEPAEHVIRVEFEFDGAVHADPPPGYDFLQNNFNNYNNPNDYNHSGDYPPSESPPPPPAPPEDTPYSPPTPCPEPPSEDAPYSAPTAPPTAPSTPPFSARRPPFQPP